MYTNGRGVDVILDIIGGDYLDKNMQAAAVDGRIVQIGLMGGIKTQINMMPLLTKRLTLMGATLRSQSNEQKGKIAQELLQLVWPLFSSKRSFRWFINISLSLKPMKRIVYLKKTPLPVRLF